MLMALVPGTTVGTGAPERERQTQTERYRERQGDREVQRDREIQRKRQRQSHRVLQRDSGTSVSSDLAGISLWIWEGVERNSWGTGDPRGQPWQVGDLFVWVTVGPLFLTRESGCRCWHPGQPRLQDTGWRGDRW